MHVLNGETLKLLGLFVFVLVLGAGAAVLTIPTSSDDEGRDNE